MTLDGIIAQQSDAAEDFVQDPTLFLPTAEEVACPVDICDGFAPGEIFAPFDAALF